MKREIQFRAWDLRRKQMFYTSTDLNVLVLKCDGWELGVEDYDWGVNGADQDTGVLMQWTGLHDKNGVPIYEGDVISFEDDAPGEVKWNQQFSCFTYFEDENINDENEVLDWSQLLERHKEHYIVLGNIHENPELIK